MKKFFINLLLGLYPRNWRNRYKEEFVALLEEYPFSLKLFADVTFGAVDAHLNYKAGVVWHIRLDIIKRLLLLALVGLVATVITWTFKMEILVALLDLARNPANTQAVNPRLITTDVSSNLYIYIEFALYGGILFASPVAFYLLLGFLQNIRRRANEKKAELTDGQTHVKRENHVLFYSIPLLTVCWLAGAIFAYLVLLPSTIQFIFNWTYLVGVQNYMDTLSKMVFWMGLVFEIPALVYLLVASGVVRRQRLLKWWPGASTLSVIIAVLMTPSLDIFSLITIALSIFFLYWLGLLAARLVSKKAEVTA